MSYNSSSLVSLKYQTGLLLTVWNPCIDLFGIVQANEYRISYTTLSIVFSGGLVILYTEIIFFLSIFLRMVSSIEGTVYTYVASDTVVIGIIIILSLTSIANTLFATTLCKEMLTTVVTKLFFCLTGLHFSHVIVGYWMILHGWTQETTITGVGEKTIISIQEGEDNFSIIYWKLVEGLWLLITALIFIFNV